MITPEMLAAPGTEHAEQAATRVAQRRAERIAHGLCRDCGLNVPVLYGVVCVGCSTRRAVWSKRAHNKRKGNNICSWCGKVSDHKTLCSACTERQIKRMRERRRDNKLLILRHFGGKCVQCGETDVRVLTLDHINGDGIQDKVSKNGKRVVTPTWYAKLARQIKAGRPLERELQILCYNDHARKDNVPWFYSEWK